MPTKTGGFATPFSKYIVSSANSFSEIVDLMNTVSFSMSWQTPNWVNAIKLRIK